MRRVKSANQVNILKEYFERDPKPRRAVVRQIVQQYATPRQLTHRVVPHRMADTRLPCRPHTPRRRTGLTHEEVFRWFRNMRNRGKPAQPAFAEHDIGGHAFKPFVRHNGEAHASGSGHGHSGDLGGPVTHHAGGGGASAGSGALDAPGLDQDDIVSNYLTEELPPLKVEEAEEQWQPTPQYRQALSQVLKGLQALGKDSQDRAELLREVVRLLGRHDRQTLHTLLQPRGPYFGQANPRIAHVTREQRAHQVRRGTGGCEFTNGHSLIGGCPSRGGLRSWSGTGMDGPRAQVWRGPAAQRCGRCVRRGRCRGAARPRSAHAGRP